MTDPATEKSRGMTPAFLGISWIILICTMFDSLANPD